MKGVMLSHRNLVANIEQLQDALTLGEDDTLVGVLPFFHIWPDGRPQPGPRQGATIVTMPRFDLNGLLDVVEGHRATLLQWRRP